MSKLVDEIITGSFEETQQFAEELGKGLRGGDVIALHGDLGSGKTTFVQGLARGLHIQAKIISPTFIILRKYEISSKYIVSSIKYFYHIDLYRIEDEKGLKGLGLEEIVNDSESIVVIEWAERMGGMLPEKRIDITFEYVDQVRRKISISKLN